MSQGRTLWEQDMSTNRTPIFSYASVGKIKDAKANVVAMKNPMVNSQELFSLRSISGGLPRLPSPEVMRPKNLQRRPLGFKDDTKSTTKLEILINKFKKVTEELFGQHDPVFGQPDPEFVSYNEHLIHHMYMEEPIRKQNRPQRFTKYCKYMLLHKNCP
mmetsp:Transcript_3377/g.6616  ORF Transcript_3377/g.6616 Transcript_3377/m.6616 type:complete len:159 (+) Transcript_3377:244-720(+)